MVSFSKSKAEIVTWKIHSPLSLIAHAVGSESGHVEACQGNSACPTEISKYEAHHDFFLRERKSLWNLAVSSITVTSTPIIAPIITAPWLNYR